MDYLVSNQKQTMEKDIMHPQKRNSPGGRALDYVELSGKVYTMHTERGAISDLTTWVQGYPDHGLQDPTRLDLHPLVQAPTVFLPTH